MSRHTHACAWCRRETVRGTAVGAPLLPEKYQAASHGGCVECITDFEEGFTNEAIIARAKARAVRLVAVAPTNARE